jgi:S-adenosylmethionine decarboxylase
MKKNEIPYIEVAPQMFHFETWLSESEEAKLKEQLEHAIVAAGFTIVNFSEHAFPVKGYTCIWLLAESHVALHTFPESHTSFVQVSSCNQEKLERFKQSDIFINR